MNISAAALNKREWTDEETLQVLDLRDEGKSALEIAQLMAQQIGRPVTRNQIVGMWRRTGAQSECACVKPENRDGGMPRRWWAR